MISRLAKIDILILRQLSASQALDLLDLAKNQLYLNEKVVSKVINVAYKTYIMRVIENRLNLRQIEKNQLTTPFCSETLAPIFSLSSLATTVAAPFALISLAIGATLGLSVAPDPLLWELLPLVFGVPLLPFLTVTSASIFLAEASLGASDSVVTTADGVSSTICY